MDIEELAKEIFIADNSRLSREDALAEWEAFKTYPSADYCWSIAEKLQPVLAEAWDVGVRTALNHAILNDNGITLRLEHLDGTPWTNPYTETS